MSYQASRKLGELLLSQHKKLVLAESCTGGGLAYAVTAVSGSSAWFDRGFVTYQAEAKTTLLGVSENTIQQHGQVSAETALAMAEGAIQHSDADVALSVTGIAGPDGAVAGKAVGTVFFGLAFRGRQSAWRQAHFEGDRHKVRESAIEFALSWLIETLQ